MVMDVGAVDGEMLSGENDATSFSSAKHESRLSVRKISNSAVLVDVGSVGIHVSRRIDANAGRYGTATSRTSFQYGMVDVWSVDTACKANCVIRSTLILTGSERGTTYSA